VGAGPPLEIRLRVENIDSGAPPLARTLQSLKTPCPREGAAMLQSASAALAVVKCGVRDDLIYVAFGTPSGGFPRG
jgi:hypothetical protein